MVALLKPTRSHQFKWLRLINLKLNRALTSCILKPPKLKQVSTAQKKGSLSKDFARLILLKYSNSIPIIPYIPNPIICPDRNFSVFVFWLTLHLTPFDQITMLNSGSGASSRIWKFFNWSGQLNNLKNDLIRHCILQTCCFIYSKSMRDLVYHTWKFLSI